MNRFKFTVALTALCAAGVLSTSSVEAKVKAKVEKRSEQLQKAVKVKNMREHQEELQEIADRNNGNRVAGSPGHVQSAVYVERELKDAGYKVTRLPFDFPFFSENSPTTLSSIAPDLKDYVADTDFSTMQYSGAGEITAVAQGVEGGLVLPPTDAPSSVNGCDPADFTGFVPGNIAVIQRGGCTFETKADNAVLAGASAVIIFNEGNPGRTDEIGGGTLNNPKAVPVISTSFAIGQELRTGGKTLRLKTDTTSEIRSTYNVLAETKSGEASRVVVVGAHLDSVAEGPGIQDNGSGSAAILEIAIQMSKGKFKTRNKVRFMWFSAEEAGLLGSEDYVASLSEADLAKIALNLNFDMIASPNFVRFVYDGDGSDTPDAGPAGSAEIEQVFNDHLAGKGLAFEATAFDGRSDYGPFIDAGIAAGGLFTGAEVLKTAEQQAIYGGTTGVAFDACYHEACDNYDNNNEQVFEEMANAAAHATWYFANKQYPQAKTAQRSARVRAGTAAKNWLYKGSHLQR